jgi:hypothetical protein
MSPDEYQDHRLESYNRRIAEFQKKGTFGAAVMLTALEEAARGRGPGRRTRALAKPGDRRRA